VTIKIEKSVGDVWNADASVCRRRSAGFLQMQTDADPVLLLVGLYFFKLLIASFEKHV